MAGFKDLAANLAELEGIPSRISTEVARGIQGELDRQFSNSVDPYGNPWKPLLPTTVKRKGGDHRILFRTDALAKATRANPSSGAGVEVTSEAYGEFHQDGTKNMVPRKILPDGSDLPEAWSDLIEKASESAFKKVMK